VGYPFLCNPLTNAGCDPGQLCQLDTWDYEYDCAPPYGLLPLCAPCEDGSSGYTPEKTCAAGTACYAGRCARPCCDDGDCTAGHCVHDFGDGLDALGFCVPP
jgi:hypothetical protein